MLWSLYSGRVAIARGYRGKQGIWMLIFSDRENIGNLPKNIRNMILHREVNCNTGNFEVLKLQDILGL